MSDHDQLILKAAAEILRDAGLDRARAAQNLNDRRSANIALQAAVSVSEYLLVLEDEERPF